MDEGARPVTGEDLPRIAELARCAIADLATHKGGAVWSQREARAEPIDAALAAELERDDVLLVAGTIDEVVVGYAAAHVQLLHDGTRLVVLTELYVEPEAREVGVGEALLDSVIEWAGAQGAVGVDALALPGDRETKNFFEAAGLVARAIVVHRKL